MNRLIFLLLASGCWSCASSLPSNRGYGDDSLQATIVTLTEKERLQPQNAEIKRNLGIALARAGHLEKAVAKLKTAKELNPLDPLTLYFYGRAADQTEDYHEAILNYSAYLDLSNERPLAIPARIHELAQIDARKELSLALRREETIDSASLDSATVAVLYYFNLSADKELAPLSRGLAYLLWEDLSRVAGLRVAGREKLHVLQEEMDLSGSSLPLSPPESSFAPLGTTIGLKERLAQLQSPRGFPYYSGPLDDASDGNFRQAVFAFQKDHQLPVDGVPGPQTRRAIEAAVAASAGAQEPLEDNNDTITRMGKLLGAGTIIRGSFTHMGGEGIQLQASVAHPLTGLSPLEGVQGPLVSVLPLQKQLTLRIFSALGIQLEDKQLRSIRSLPTKRFPAFMAFCRGLDYEARGSKQEAALSYREALGLDPDFAMAQESLKIVNMPASRIQEYTLHLLAGPSKDLSGRLYRTGGWIGMGPGLILDRNHQDDTLESATKKIEPARIVIEGDLPGETQP